MASPWGLGLGFQPYLQQDDGLSPLSAVVQGCRTATSAPQRLAWVEASKTAALDSSYEECAELLLPLLEALLDDADAEVQLVTLRELPQLGELLRTKDPGRAYADLRHTLLPVIASLALNESAAVTSAAVTAFAALVALLPQDTAAAEVQSAVAQLEAVASEDAPVQAVRLFAHSAAAWPPHLLAARAPELLRRWCGHRDFAVREAAACCLSLVGRTLPLDAWYATLLPWLSQLVRDSNWRVRHAAALDLPRLAGKLHRCQQLQQSSATKGASCIEPDSSAAAGSSAHSCASTPTAAGGGGCFVCYAADSSCGACSGDCGSITANTACCRISDVGVIVPLPDSALFGCCAHLGKRERAGGNDDRHSRHRQGRRSYAAVAAANHRLVCASLPTSVWSLQAQRPTDAGLTGTMGKHPLSSSLLLDSPAGRMGLRDPSPSPTASSSLSSSDGANPLRDSLQAACCGETVGGGSSDAEGGPVAEEPQEEEEQQGQAADDSACDLIETEPVLHACWTSLRDSLDSATADSSHWVRVIALAGLGPCLLALPPCQISSELLSKFSAMGSSSTVVYSISVALACAQSLGPVASRLGPRRWPDVRPAFLSLQSTREPVVLQELVTSLPLLAHHLGEPALQLDLLPALLAAAHDHLNWVEAAVVEAAPPLVAALPPATGEQLLRLLSRIATGDAGDTENCRAWRVRRNVAESLGQLARAARREAISDVLWPLAVTLCSDPVAAVRDAAAAQIGPLLSALLPLVEQEQLRAVEGTSSAKVLADSGDAEKDARQHDQGSWPGQGQELGGGDLMEEVQAVGACGDQQSVQCSGPQPTGSGCGAFEGGTNNIGSCCSSSSANCCIELGPAAINNEEVVPSHPSVLSFGCDGASRPLHLGFTSPTACGGPADYEEDALFCSLPCALAAPPCDGLAAGLSSLQPFGAEAHPAAQPQLSMTNPCAASSCNGVPVSQLPSSSLPCSATTVDGDRTPGTNGWASSDSDSDAGDSASPRQPPVSTAAAPTVAGGLHPPPRSPLRPNTGTAITCHSALRMSGGIMHPGMAPVGTWGAPPPPSSSTSTARRGRCASTGELAAMSHGASPQTSVRRHASAGRLCCGSPVPSSTVRLDPLAPHLSPGLYVDCLIQRFAHNPSWQGRQLFVTMGLGLLAAPPLPPRKQEMVLAALETLAGDRVVGVRLAAQAAAAALRCAGPAAGREGCQQQVARQNDGGASCCNGANQWQGGVDGSSCCAAGYDCAGCDDDSLNVVPPSGPQPLLAAARALASGNSDLFEAAVAALRGSSHPARLPCTAPLPIAM